MNKIENRKINLGDSTGFTLVELLVSIALFSIFVGISIGGFVSALNTQKQVTGLLAVQGNASEAIEEMTRDMRTGYLFCHDAGSGTPTSTCGCTVTGSGWDCSALTYINALGQSISYSLVSGALQKNINGTAQPVTGNNVNVKYLNFFLFGNTEGDNWPPRVTVAIGVAASSTNPALQQSVVHFQTTISARGIDCTQINPVSC